MHDMIDPEPRTPGELLLAELKRLRQAVGDPSSRAIARGVGTVSHTTVAEIFAGRRAPSWSVLADIVRYLGGSESEFRELWEVTATPDLTAPPGRSEGAGRVRGDGFVGRAKELDTLGSLLTQAMTGKPATVLLDGEAGVGKSRLVAAFAEDATQAGAQVLTGACIGLSGGPVPYAPLVEILHRLQRAHDSTAARILAEPAFTELTRLISAIDATEAARVPGPQAPVFALTLRLIERLNAEGPVVLILEDLQWADPSTLDLILYLTRARTDQRLLLLCTYRSGLQRGDPLRQLLSEPSFARLTARMRLQPFTELELAVFLRLRGQVDRDQIRRIFELSEGNAFFAEELLHSGMRAGQRVPDTIAQLVGGQTDRLSADAAKVLRIAAVARRQVRDTLVLRATAVADQQVNDGLLKVITGLDDLVLNDALRECRDAGLLIPDQEDGIYRFRHALQREAVYRDLLASERRLWHTAVAQALTEQPELGVFGQGAATAIELAYHWYQTGRKPDALAAAVRAGAAATGMRAFREALSHYEKALALWPEVPEPAANASASHIEVLKHGADAARWAGHVEMAVSLIQRAVEEANVATDRLTAGRLYERLGSYMWEAGAMDKSAEAYQQAESMLDPGAHDPVLVRVKAELASVAVLAGRYSEGRRRAEDAIALARSTEARAEKARALNIAGVAQAMLGDTEEGIRSLHEAVRVAGEVNSLEDQLRAYGNLAVVLEEAGHLDKAVDEAREGFRLAVHFGLGDTRRGRLLANNASANLFLLGRWDEAKELLDAALRTDPPVAESAYVRLTLAELDVAQGHFAEATQLLAVLRDHVPPSDLRFLEYLDVCAAELALWQCDPLTALAATADRVIAMVDRSENVHALLRLFAVALRAGADLPDRDAAIRHANRLKAMVDDAMVGQRSGAREIPVLVMVCQAEHNRASGRDTAQDWNAVAEGWEELHRPYPAAYARWRQALACVTIDGKQQAALAARRLARPLAAEPLLSEIDKVLGTSPRATRSSSSGNDFGLTARELEVLSQVAAGRTNREIARALSIGESTVGVHIGNVLRKLHVRSRSEAIVLAAEHQLLPG